jgi:hypothetical protein
VPNIFAGLTASLSRGTIDCTVALGLKTGSPILLAVVLLGSAASYSQTPFRRSTLGPNSSPEERFYGALKGKVYSIYIDTALGTVVMEYADHLANHPYADDLVAPQPVRAKLPALLKLSPLMISSYSIAPGR